MVNLSAYWRGFLSVFSSFPQPPVELERKPLPTVAQSLAGDWQRVGDTMRDVMARCDPASYP